MKIIFKTFSTEEGHIAGIPGHQGGSKPAGSISLYKPLASTISRAYNAKLRVIEGFVERFNENNIGPEPNMSVDKAINDITTDIKELVDNNPISIRRSAETSLKILKNGRFKTQFETKQSGGCYNPKYRMEAEEYGLGVPPDIDVKQRPVYGYINNPQAYGELDVSPYGPVEFVMKDEVKDRATITIGDSLGDFADTSSVGLPYKSDTFGLECITHSQTYSLLREYGVDDYIEAQIQGGVKLSDIAKVVLHKSDEGYNKVNQEEIKSYYEKAGIKVEFVEDI